MSTKERVCVCVCVCVLTVHRLRVGQVLLELLVEVFTDSDVLEHPLQFGRVLEAARLLHDDNNNKQPSTITMSTQSDGFGGRGSGARRHLQLGDHAGLGVVAGAVLVDEALGEHLGVELLEDVFVLDVLEHNHLGKGAGPKNEGGSTAEAPRGL